MPSRTHIARIGLLCALVCGVSVVAWAIVDPTSPNMGLKVPIPGQTPGPQYATEISADLNVIDAHNHSPGKGVLIPTNGLSLNADLTFNSFNATGLRSVRLVPQLAPIALGGDLNALYSVGGDLYYNNGTGTQIHLTSGSSINASLLGGFTGLAGTNGEALYTPLAGGSFAFYTQTSPLTFSLMKTGPLAIYDTAGGQTVGVGIRAPVGMDAGYALTLPINAPPVGQRFVLDTNGTLSFGPAPGVVNGLVQMAGSGTVSVGPAPLTTNGILQMNSDGGVTVGPPAPSVASLVTMGADGGLATLALPTPPATYTSSITMTTGGVLGLGSAASSGSSFGSFAFTGALTGGLQTLAIMSITSHGGAILVSPVGPAGHPDAGPFNTPGAFFTLGGTGTAQVSIRAAVDTGAQFWATKFGGDYPSANAYEYPAPTFLIPSAANGGPAAGTHILSIDVQLAASGSGLATVSDGTYQAQEIQ